MHPPILSQNNTVPSGSIKSQASCQQKSQTSSQFTSNSPSCLATMLGNDGGMMGGQMHPPPPMMPQQMMAPQMMAPQPHGQVVVNQDPPNNWVGNDANTLLLVATLITTLSYQLGSNIPGGYWQDTQLSADGKRVLHLAGDPIMRDLHRARYWVFTAASWIGFVGSMLMTLSLLVKMPVESRHVRWSFAVAYSSLVLTFIVSQSKTHLSLDILVWAGVVAFLWLMISVREGHRARIIRFFCCVREN